MGFGIFGFRSIAELKQYLEDNFKSNVSNVKDKVSCPKEVSVCCS